MNELMDFSINKFKELLSYFNMLKKIYFKNKLWKWYLLYKECFKILVQIKITCLIKILEVISLGI